MKSDPQLKRTLDSIEKRLSRLESTLIKADATPKKREKRKLSDHILDLRNSGFFSQPRTAAESHKKLQETYHCEQNRVDVALLRLSKRKMMRRATKVVGKKRYQAYVW